MTVGTSSWCYCSVAKSCLTLCDPMDYSPAGSSVYGIFQARILEWVAISFPRASCWPRDQTCISCLAGKFFPTEPPGKPVGTYIPIIALNINGLNDPTKRYRLAEWVKKQLPYMCYLQKTHFRSRNIHRLKARGLEKGISWKWKSKENWRECLGGPVVKNPHASIGDMGSSPGLGRSHMP